METETIELLQVLQLACSQNPVELKVGEKHLEAWKRQEGFYSGLAGVFTNRGVDSAVRWMALTCIKNGVEQFWRPGAISGISPEEKGVVRTSLLQCIEEEVSQVSTQLAVLIARIARMDCPEQWPELLPVLTEGAHSSSEFTRKCYLKTLKHVIKCLAARRLIPQKKFFYDVTTNLFVYIVQLWNKHLQEGVALLSRGEGQSAVEILDMVLLCLKILRQMIVYGFPKFHGIIEALEFVKTLLERIPVLVQLRGQLPSDHTAAREILERNINLKMKIITEVQSHNPIGFAPFVLSSLELIRNLVFSLDRRAHLFEKLVITCLNFLRFLIRCEDYNPPRSKDIMTTSVTPPGILEAHHSKLTFFEEGTCKQLLEQLVGHYLLLSEEDMCDLEENPEDFAKEEPGDVNTCSLRSCVESALVALVHEFQTPLVPCLLMLVEGVQGLDGSAELSSLIIKEAVYNAMGLCAFEVYDSLDYDSWYQNQLTRELSIRSQRYTQVRHRVVWLLGQWVTIKMSPSLRPSLYSAVIPLLRHEENMAVRLEAANVIHICVDDLDFTVEDFAPFLSSCTEHLFLLLHECHKVETKMQVLNVLSLLMERMGPAIQPHVATLLQALPPLWEESGDHNASILRSIIVSTLTNICKGLGSESVGLHDFILPVIKLATDVKSSDHVYLAEDGLILWLTVLQHISTPSPALIQLLGNMIGLLGLDPPSDESSTTMAGLMDIGSENLKVCFNVLDSYAVLCSLQPEYFFESCREVIVRACQCYLCDVKPEGVVIIVDLMSRVVEVYSGHAPNIMEPLLPAVLRKLIEEEDYPPTTSAYLSLVARVLIHQPTTFFSFLEKMAAQSEQTASQLFGLVVDTWSARLDSVGSLKCRKLTGLAISNILPMVDPCVTARFDSLINMCVDVLHDVMDTTDDNQLYDIFVMGRDRTDEDKSSIDTNHDCRENMLSQYDPIRTISLHEHFGSKLEQCLSVHGSSVYTTLITKVDIAVREQLLEFIPLKAAGQLLNIFLPENQLP